MTTFHKLELLLLNLGDICIPVPGDPWILVDADDNDLAEGMTLEQAAARLPGDDAEEFSEVERLNSVIAAQRRLLIQWTEAYQELVEQTKFITQ